MKLRTIFFLSIPVLLFGCNRQTDKGMKNGTAWAAGSFNSNGERIYFTASSDRGTSITYTGGPSMGMMMIPPMMIALPFKILLFILVDGWNLIIGSMVRSFL